MSAVYKRASRQVGKKGWRSRLKLTLPVNTSSQVITIPQVMAVYVTRFAKTGLVCTK